MKKILIIIQREYITRIRKRAFIISTLLAPLGFFALIGFSVLMSGYSSSNKKLAIVDESGLFKDAVFPDAADGSVTFQIEKSISTVTADPKEGKKQKYDAIVEIPAGFDIDNPTKTNISCISEKGIGMISSTYINKTFSEKLRQVRAQHLHLDPDQLESLSKDIELTYHKLSDEGSKNTNASVGVLFGYFVGMAIYILLMVYGTMIMRGVMEEKTSRIMEVLVSSVKPVQLMIGKIIGIGAVGLTQFILWILLIVGGTIFVMPMLGLSSSQMKGMHTAGIHSQEIDPDSVQSFVNVAKDFHFGPIIVVLILFFLGGFLLYGSLFAAVGAAGGDENDSQSLVFPIMLPIIITVAMMMNVLSQPEGKLAFWTSLIPFCSPIIMPALMPSNPPLWQIGLSLVMLFGGFVLCAMLAAKIYRTGVLMYGKKTTFKEIGRWIFAKN